MLRVRLLTAVLLLPLVLAAFLYGPEWFVGLFLLLCVTLCLFEAIGMLLPALEKRLAGVEAAPDSRPFWQKVTTPKGHALQLATAVIGWSMFLVSVFETHAAGRGLIVIGMLAAMIVGVFSDKNLDRAFARVVAMVLTLAWTVLPWLAVWDLYLMGDHSKYILLILAVTWLGDTGGYFGGRFLGGKVFGARKMAPAISPKKTWEGAFTGLVMSVLGALALNGVFMGTLGSWGLLAATGAVAGVAGQTGDLVESTFKRFSGVKDSGVIIPGHGGFLDRVDAILFSAPVIWFILYYFK